ncbi:MAG: sigma-70 family RNA polymerase sigma factor [Bacteroidaceae bacterium]|nr:sigma-70 family RNA polymerase sigma factor [Bacteroidaceae bacterium]MBQ9294989.1 sigma-70 family RNA polymerase sigma factor [Bacteroidaceae bacterium]
MEHSEFERFAPALRTKVMCLAESFFQKEEKAEDVAQETMIRLWKAWPALPSLPDAERLAVRIAKHECIDVWRREQRRPHTSLSPAHEETSPAPSDGHSLEENELTEAIRSASSRLRRSEERLWRMFAEAGMQPGEIALATGIHVRTVSAMLSHARHIIYNILKEGGYIDE